MTDTPGEKKDKPPSFLSESVVYPAALLTVALITIFSIRGMHNREAINKVGKASTNAIHTNTLNVVIPNELVSQPEQNKIIDITNPEQVANAMNITLTGEKDQVLFGVEINSKTLPVTVEMLPRIAEAINTLENTLVSPDGKKSISPENFKSNGQDNEAPVPAR